MKKKELEAALNTGLEDHLDYTLYEKTNTFKIT
jgi:hypothetical protein